MRIRAKVRVDARKVFNWTPGQTEVTCTPVHATEIPEDQQYSQATPTGEIRLVMKDAAADHFPLGKQFYVDFSPVDAE